MKMNSIWSRYKGFWVYALTVHFICWILRIDVLESVTIFSNPGMIILVVLASLLWLLLDAAQLRAGNGIRRHLVFWTPTLLIALGGIALLRQIHDESGFVSGLMMILLLSVLALPIGYQLVLDLISWNKG